MQGSKLYTSFSLYPLLPPTQSGHRAIKGVVELTKEKMENVDYKDRR